MRRVGCPPEAPCACTLDVAAAGTTPAITASTSSAAASCRLDAAERIRDAPLASGHTAGTFGDGEDERSPSRRAGGPDLLDEARFGLHRRRPRGCRCRPDSRVASMVHPQDPRQRWSAIPTSPARDDIKRNLPLSEHGRHVEPRRDGGAERRCASWQTLDPAFSARCLGAARAAYAAAEEGPAVCAEPRYTRGRRTSGDS